MIEIDLNLPFCCQLGIHERLHSDVRIDLISLENGSERYVADLCVLVPSW